MVIKHAFGLMVLASVSSGAYSQNPCIEKIQYELDRRTEVRLTKQCEQWVRANPHIIGNYTVDMEKHISYAPDETTLETIHSQYKECQATDSCCQVVRDMKLFLLVFRTSSNFDGAPGYLEFGFNGRFDLCEIYVGRSGREFYYWSAP